jgi:hypothetical protein
MQNCFSTDRAKENKKKMTIDDVEQKKRNCHYFSAIPNFEIILSLWRNPQLP